MIFKICFYIAILFISENAYATVWEDFSSPFMYEESQKVILFGASATLLASLFKNSFIKTMEQELHEDRPLCCRVTRAGNSFLQIFPNAIYAIGFGFDFYFNRDENSKRRAIGMAKATLYSGLVADILKPIVDEKRPNGGSYSFPSGHTTTAFAFASFVASEHPWYVGVPAYVMASFVGLCRMHDEYHYFHDVLAGATIGMSYGIATSLKSKQDENSNSAFFLTPTDEFKGVAFRYTLEF